jgi:rare lipoprotein A
LNIDKVFVGLGPEAPNDNGRSVILKINDRGPYTRGRVLDLSPGAADALDMKHAGVVAVVIEPLLTSVRTVESF